MSRWIKTVFCLGLSALEVGTLEHHIARYTGHDRDDRPLCRVKRVRELYDFVQKAVNVVFDVHVIFSLCQTGNEQGSGRPDTRFDSVFLSGQR